MINLHCQEGGSWGVLGRSFATALAKRTAVAILDLDGDSPSSEKTCEPSSDAITVNFGDWKLSESLPGRRVVSYIPWETSRVPWPIRRLLRRLDHLWVPTGWQRDLFIANGIPSRQLSVVPCGFDPTLFHPRSPQLERRAPFRFVFIGKWEERKAIPILLEAFGREFAPDEEVELVLHAHNPFIADFDQEKMLQNALVETGATGRRIRCVGHMGQLTQAYHDADAFVLPTRSEGWGLPLLEAMACGLPCIATRYSGLTDFANDGNARLIEVEKLIRVRDPTFFNPWLRWGKWAQPSVTDLRRHLRWMIDHREEAKALGTAAALEMQAKWTWDHAAAIAMARLRELE